MERCSITTETQGNQLMMCWGHHPDVLHHRQQPKTAELSGASPSSTSDIAVQVAASSALIPDDSAGPSCSFQLDVRRSFDAGTLTQIFRGHVFYDLSRNWGVSNEWLGP